MSVILKEFRAVSQPSLGTLTQVFSKMGKLARLGGPERVYEIEDKHAVAYAIGTSAAVVAFGWVSSPSSIETIFYWNEFSFARVPDYAIDLPENGDITVLAPTILKMIDGHMIGNVEA